MPAMLEDPTAPVVYRTSGAPPYPTPSDTTVPANINTRQVTLRDRITIASLIPLASVTSIPPRLLNYLCSQLNLEIEKGDTYPMTHSMPVTTFGTYWFQNFGAIMFLGDLSDMSQVAREEEAGIRWEEKCLGSFYIKPNYPGRSSHVCNGGFLVTEAARNKGVGRLMGEGYLEWAPKLGYSYSVFNLVYETNVASCRIWDALGFKRIGRVKGCGNLRSNPEELVDAIIYGRDLGPDGEDYVSEERFDKIRFYLKHGKYPNGADRAEKSRLRSAATHYKLLPAEDGDEREDNERLMLKDKEVISDPQRQYEIARNIHAHQHGGINKTTATIAEKYHWVRIKETVSLVIKNCSECKDTTQKSPVVRPPPAATAEYTNSAPKRQRSTAPTPSVGMVNHPLHFEETSASGIPRTQPIANTRSTQQAFHQAAVAPVAHMRPVTDDYSHIPLDPQIMQSQSRDHYRQQQQPTHPDNFEDGMRQVAESLRTAEERMEVDNDNAHSQVPDTRLASERHVRQGDDPLAYQDAQGAMHELGRHHSRNGQPSMQRMDLESGQGGS